jgi:N-acetylmuramoyl-L-alanine amidase
MNIIQTNLNWKGTFNFTNVPQMLILHHAEACVCTIEDIEMWHQERGWIGVGYHYFIRKDGSIYKGRPDNAEGAQCYGYNDNSLGICYEGNYMVDDMPEVQKQSGIELNKYLMNLYKISRIEPHRALYNTSCPGDKFPFDEIKNTSLNNQGSAINYQPIQNRSWLQVGDTGDKVTDLQTKLSKLGYAVTVDGVYGKETKNVVYKFQQDNKLQQDGLAGTETFNCLNSKVAQISCNPVIKSFQHASNLAGITDKNGNKLSEDGISGTSTDSAIAKITTILKGSSGELVKWIQQRLINLGFNLGTSGVDGNFGYYTLAAIQNFQSKNGLTPDGTVGQLTLAALLK